MRSGTGAARDGYRLFPPMLFATYQYSTADLAAALIAYLR
jgi:hypothetical protein